MSLVPGYSSDEDNGPSSPTRDVFGLSNIPAAKKMRVDEAGPSLIPQAAPHVLAEVEYSLLTNRCSLLTHTPLGPAQSDISGDPTN